MSSPSRSLNPIEQPSPDQDSGHSALRGPRRFPARLIEKRRLAGATWHLRLAVDAGFEYESGQFILVHHESGGQIFRLPYSIASPSRSGVLELCVNCPGEGPLKGFPCQFTEETRIECEGPFGLMVPRSPERDALLVAHGTGIGPIRSILHDLASRPHSGRLILLFGARTEDSILYKEEWDALERMEPRFQFLPTLTQPSAAWRGLRGQVQQHLAPFFERRELAVYMCGSPAMVSDVRARFTEAGFDGHQLIYERYGER